MTSAESGHNETESTRKTEEFVLSNFFTSTEKCVVCINGFQRSFPRSINSVGIQKRSGIPRDQAREQAALHKRLDYKIM